MSEMTTVPTSLLDRLFARFDRDEQPEKPEPTPAPVANVDEFKVQIEQKEAEIAQYKAKVEQMQAAANAAERIAMFGTELAQAPAVAGDHELHAILARLPEEDAAKLVTKFKALSAQIDEAGLTGEAGAAGNGQPNDETAVVAIAQKYADEHKISFNAAISKLAVTRPELFEVVK